MPQFARPSVDTNNPGAWVEDGVGNDGFLFDEIDEAVASDVDFVQSPLAPVAAVYVTKLSAVTDPGTVTGHIVRYRYGKNAAAGQAVTIVVELRTGYVSEGSPGTLIHAETHVDVPAGFTNGSFTLSAGEAAAFAAGSGYSDGYLRFSATAV